MRRFRILPRSYPRRVQAFVFGAAALLVGCPQLMRDDFHRVGSVSVDETGGQGSLAAEAGVGASAVNEGVADDGVGGTGGRLGTGGADSAAQAGAAGSSIDEPAAAGGAAGSPIGDPAAVGAAGVDGASGATGTMGNTGGSAGIVAGGASNAGSQSTGGVPDEGETDCSNKVVLDDAFVTGFEDYDGVTEPEDWQFVFNSRAQPISGGLLDYGDETGVYTLEFVDGANSSSYAVQAANTAASSWGGGVKLWVHCIDASSFTGLQFRIKGHTPAGTAEVGLDLDNDQLVGYQFDMPETWTVFQVPFDDFVANEDTPTASTNGDDILVIRFSSQLVWTPSSEYPYYATAETGDIQVVVDDVGFY